MSALTEQLVAHDIDDTRMLLDLAKGLPDEDYRRAQLPGNTTLSWDGTEESLADVLTKIVFTKEVWLAAIEGTDFPAERSDDPATLVERHDEAAPRWLAAVRDFERPGRVGRPAHRRAVRPAGELRHQQRRRPRADLLAHRRQLARQLIRGAGHEVDSGDPINWLRAQRGEEPGEDIG